MGAIQNLVATGVGSKPSSAGVVPLGVVLHDPVRPTCQGTTAVGTGLSRPVVQVTGMSPAGDHKGRPYARNAMDQRPKVQRLHECP